MKAHNNFRFLAIVLLVIQLLVVSCNAPAATETVKPPAQAQLDSTETPENTPTPTSTTTPTVTLTVIPSVTPTKTPTPTKEPTKAPWEINAEYFKLTFYTSDGRLRFPPPGFAYDNTKTYEQKVKEFSAMIEANTLPTFDFSDPKLRQALGETALRLVPEAIAAGWRGAIDCGECQMGIGQGRISTGVSIDSEYGVYPLALARAKAGGPDDYIGLYLVNHDGNYTVIFLKMDFTLSAMWGHTYNRSHLMFTHDTDAEAGQTLQILKDIAHGKRSGVVADWVFTLAGTGR
jgi:hypothetical protein